MLVEDQDVSSSAYPGNEDIIANQDCLKDSDNEQDDGEKMDGIDDEEDRGGGLLNASRWPGGLISVDLYISK